MKPVFYGRDWRDAGWRTSPAAIESVCQSRSLFGKDDRKEILYRIMRTYNTICALWNVGRALMNRLIMSPYAGSGVGSNRHVFFFCCCRKLIQKIIKKRIRPHTNERHKIFYIRCFLISESCQKIKCIVPKHKRALKKSYIYLYIYKYIHN